MSFRTRKLTNTQKKSKKETTDLGANLGNQLNKLAFLSNGIGVGLPLRGPTVDQPLIDFLSLDTECVLKYPKLQVS